MDAITDLAEQLAERIQHSVAVDDAELRLLGSSRHFGDADPLRLASLANRRIEGRVREATFAAGLPQWRQPHRGRALGFDGHEHDRMAFPLRSRHGLLGVMWVILVDEQDLSEEQMQECLAVARQMERLLIRQEQEDFETDLEVETLLFTLLSDETEDRRIAVRDLLDLGIFQSSTEVVAVVMTVGEADEVAEPEPGEERSAVIRRALKQATSSSWGRSAAAAVTQEQAFLLIGSRGSAARSEYQRTAERVLAEVSQLDPGLSYRLRIGIGTPVQLEEALHSYDRATVAARIAGDKKQHVALWEDHPLEGLLAAAIRSVIEAAWVPPLIAETVESQSQETLETVSCFLDEAGNVARTSEILHLHRTTVYYRLRQFEKETGLSLDAGNDRLLLQLWFRVRSRVAG